MAKGVKPADQDIDLGLAIISAITPRGYCWTYDEQAYVCGCSRERMRQIGDKALRKCRFRLREVLREQFGDNGRAGSSVFGAGGGASVHHRS